MPRSKSFERGKLALEARARGNIHAAAHKIAVALLHHIPEMDAYAELDAALRRQTRVLLDHAGLNFDGAADRVDHAAGLDDAAVPRAPDDATVMRGDGRVDQVAAAPPSRASVRSSSAPASRE